MNVDPVLSIVVGGAPDHSAAAQLSALLEHLGSVPLELILSGGPAATPCDSPDRWRVTRIPADPAHRLVPECWGEGLRVAQAPLVAFFSSDTLPTPTWWPRLQAVLTDPTVAAVAGGIALDPGSTPDRAVFLARYSAFLPREDPTTIDTESLPGEATIYRRDLLLADPTLHQPGQGFWEVSHHRRLREGGWRLRSVAEPVALFVGRPDFVAFVQQRCSHARQFGAERVAGGTAALALTLRAPLVPGVMLARVVRRAWGNRWGRQALPRALPRLVAYLTAWAFGEAWGAWQRHHD